jgi:FMN reductase
MITAVSAGLGSPSASTLLATRLSQSSERALATAPGTRVIELRDHAKDITNALLTGVPSVPLREVIEQVTSASGLIAVTPVFNASYSGLFKMFFDILDPDALTGKPVLVAAAGNSPRHSLVIEHEMKPMFGYLRAMLVPTGVYASGDDWSDPELAKRIDRAAEELAALVQSRPVSAPADPYASFTPIGNLLTRGR